MLLFLCFPGGLWESTDAADSNQPLRLDFHSLLASFRSFLTQQMNLHSTFDYSRSFLLSLIPSPLVFLPASPFTLPPFLFSLLALPMFWRLQKSETQIYASKSLSSSLAWWSVKQQRFTLVFAGPYYCPQIMFIQCSPSLIQIIATKPLSLSQKAKRIAFLSLVITVSTLGFPLHLFPSSFPPFLGSLIFAVSNSILFTSILQKLIMACVIEGTIFNPLPPLDNALASAQQQDLSQRVSRIMKINEDSFALRAEDRRLEFATRVRLLYYEFAIRSQLCWKTQTIRTLAFALQGRQYFRGWSKHTDLLLLRELARRQKEASLESCLILHQGRITLALSNYAIKPELLCLKNRMLYRRVVFKNLLHFQEILVRYFRRGTRVKELGDFEKNLMLSKILHTTNTNMQVSEEKSQFRFASQSFQRQSEQLAAVEKGIIDSSALERGVGCLFAQVELEQQSQYLRGGLLEMYQRQGKKLKKLLILKYPQQRTVEDYIYNTVKVDIFKDCFPIGDGGTSTVYAYRMNLTFLGSVEMGYKPIQESKVEKIVAVKKPKGNFEGKRDKIAHEKMIVQHLKSSVSYFIPKYYGVDRDSQLGNCLLMQMIDGEELDFYIAARGETMSLWTKLYLMINVLHGLRHLLEYSTIHLDLKPINIMVCAGLITKIIDYGEAYHRDVCPKNYTPGFTFPYVAPEVFIRFLRQSTKREDSLQFSEKQDVFALGIVLSEVFFGTRIFYLSNPRYRQVYTRREILQCIFQAPERNSAYGDDLLTSSLALLITRCLDPDPSLRPRVEWVAIALKEMYSSHTP